MDLEPWTFQSRFLHVLVILNLTAKTQALICLVLLRSFSLSEVFESQSNFLIVYGRFRDFYLSAVIRYLLSSNLVLLTALHFWCFIFTELAWNLTYLLLKSLCTVHCCAMLKLITRTPLDHIPRKRILLCLSWRHILSGLVFITHSQRSVSSILFYTVI